MAIYDLLQQNPLFNNMDQEEIAEALRLTYAQEEHYAAGEVIFREGDAIDCAGIVLEGCIQVIRYDYNGNRDIIGQMPAPGLFAEALCLCSEGEIPVNVVAKVESRILRIRLKGITLPPKIQQNLLAELSVKVLDLTNKIRIIQQKTTAEKLMCFFRSESKVKRSNSFTISFSRQELADYLGVDRSAMIVELRRLKSLGLIDVAGKNIQILKNQTLL